MIKHIAYKFISMCFNRFLSFLPFKKKKIYKRKSDDIKVAFYNGLSGLENRNLFAQYEQLNSLINNCLNSLEALSLSNKQNFSDINKSLKIIEQNLNYLNKLANNDKQKIKLAKYPSFSIVVNTYNRAETLRQTLDSFKYLRYPGDFEIIVVNGPSTDETGDILKGYKDTIKIASIKEKNISKSRNVGIALAKGDIVAFIDDDAVPESDWIFDLSKCYLDNSVGCAGGRVYDSTGYNFQTQYITSNRFGESSSHNTPFDSPYFPKSFAFPLCMGTNCSFRRDVLISIGGFDEEIEYFLDENDVIARVIDAGYRIKQADNAFVHHKFYKSHLRNSDNQMTNYYCCFKNKLYHSLQNVGFDNSSFSVINHALPFFDSFRNLLIEQNKTSEFKFSLSDFDMQVSSALDKAFYIYYSDKPKKIISNTLLEKYKDMPFLKFNSCVPSQAIQIVFVFRFYLSFNGNATALNAIAKKLVKKGVMVHIICESNDSVNRVYFDNGVWVHALKVVSSPTITLNSFVIPQSICDWSTTAYKECERIEKHHHINFVECSIWDAEALSFSLNKKWTLVTYLVTPLAVWGDCNKEKMSNRKWVDSFYLPMIEAEKYVLMNTDIYKADSADIISTIEEKYNLVLSKNETEVVYLGIDPIDNIEKKPSDSKIRILFLGRLESRKGIDILLEVIPSLLAKHNNLVFEIAGNDKIEENGTTYKDAFLNKFSNNNEILNAVNFYGEVSEKEKNDLFNNCDIFVAPSRYESFELVILEAMRSGKPVICSNCGGMKEVVTDGSTGYLINPGDSNDLEQKLLKLIKNEYDRIRFGKNGKMIFNEKFTSDVFAENSLNLYKKRMKRDNGSL